MKKKPHASFLIADDSAGKTTMLTLLLKRYGWTGHTYAAQTTEEAMKVIDEDPSVMYAFVDYYIPSRQGPAIIKYLKQKNPKARIALVSSSYSESNSKEARAAGADAIICTSDPSDQVEFHVKEVLEDWF